MGEIETLTNIVDPAPEVSYGGLQWTSFMTAQGTTGYWAPTGNGQYYYFGPDGTLYLDSYPDEMKSSDMAANAIGNATTYAFPQPGAQPDYGGLNWTPFLLPDGDTGCWAPNGSGEYYNYGPDGTLYLDAYPGEVHAGDLGNAVGKVNTYVFPS